MTKYTLYLGLNDKQTKKAKYTWRQAVNMLTGMLPDCTMIPAIGKYTHDDKVSVVVEKTVKIEILDFNGDFRLADTVNQLKDTFNQESIGVQIEQVRCMLM
jgi:hypothetical protein